MKKNGFTLIELLIVIAIILILIAIALPNFLEAQIRARVTKSKGEIRSIGIAMEAYNLDWKMYPYESEDDCALVGLQHERCGLSWLTAPIAYMTDIPEDPFPGQDHPEWYELGIKPVHPGLLGVNRIALGAATWALWTRGPDSTDSELNSDNAGGGVTWEESGTDGSADHYSATNGTKSVGDIWIFGGDSFWIGVTNGTAVKPVQGIDPLVVDEIPYVHRFPPNS